LTYTAAWGKGEILDVAFASDGSFFVVGSAAGAAIYDIRDLNPPPRWMPWTAPIAYERLSISQDNQYVLLEWQQLTSNRNRSTKTQVYSLLTGTVVDVKREDVAWVSGGTYNDPRQVVSPDHTKQFTSSVKYGNMYLEVEQARTDTIVTRGMFDIVTGETMYSLTDHVPYVTLSDRSTPEGCDIATFSTCAEAYFALPSAPYQVAFSPSGDTFTVLYRPLGLYGDEQFGLLRVYRTADGQLLHTIGSFNEPVKDFVYAPDSKTLLVAFVRGFIQLWDIEQGKATFTAWHFSMPLHQVTHSKSGNYLLTWRFGRNFNMLEARRTSDGGLRGRYDATAFDVSPVEDHVAIGYADGSIDIVDLDTDETLEHIQVHDGLIFSLAFSPDGAQLVSSGQDCQVKIWNVQAGEFLHDFEAATADPYGDFGLDPSRIFVWHTQFIPALEQLIGFGSWGTVVNWDIRSGDAQYVIESAPLEFYNGMMTVDPHYPSNFDLDLGNNRFYIGDQSYDLDSGDGLGKHGQQVVNVPTGCEPRGVVSADGKLMFSIGKDQLEGRVCIVDLQTLHLVQTIQVITESVRVWISGIYLSPDGAQLVVGTTDGIIHIYQVK
jgi:WD40 repeat protein